MKLLFITDNFPPEVNAPATRTYEHCREWVRQGADVTVITTQPNFPRGEIYSGYKNRLIQKEQMEGIQVIRLFSYITSNSGVFRRSIDYFSLAIASSIYGLSLKFDVVIATSPQFFTTWAARFLSFWKRKPWVFELRDLWPESILAVGAIQNRQIIDALHKVEMSLYRSADLIIPNTPAFKEHLISRGIPDKKIHIIANGTNVDQFYPRDKSLKLIEKLGLSDKFVIGYIGTHGLAHSLPFIVDSLDQITDLEIHFLFIGDGAEKEKVVQIAKEKNLSNVTFLDSISKELVPDYLSIVDCSLVSLKKRDTFKKVIPSKIFESCAMGNPILLGVEGLAKEIINGYNVGICFEPENRESFINAVQMMKQNPIAFKTYQENTKTLTQDFDRKLLADEMLTKIGKLLPQK